MKESSKTGESVKSIWKTYSASAVILIAFIHIAFILTFSLISDSPAFSKDQFSENLKQSLFLYREGELDAAEMKLKKELTRARKGSSKLLRIRFYLARIKYKKSPELGLAELRSILEEQRKTFGEKHPDTIETSRTLSGCLKEQDKPGEAIDVLKKTLEGEKQLFGKDDFRVQRTVRLINDSEAKQKTEKSAEISAGVIERPEVMGKLYYRQGIVAFRANDFDRALTELKRARSVYDKNPEKSDADLAQIFLLLGKVERIKGNNIAAKENLQKSNALAKRFNDAKTRAKSLRELALVQDELGETNAAAQSFSESMDLAKHSSLVDELVESALALANMQFRLGHNSDGYRSLDAAISFMKPTKTQNDSFKLSELIFAKANFLFKDRKLSQCKSLFQEASALVPKMKTPCDCECVYMKACLLDADGKKDQAFAILKEFVEYAKVHGKNEMIAKFYLKMGQILQSEAKIAEAKTAFSLSRQYALREGNRFLAKEAMGEK